MYLGLQGFHIGTYGDLSDATGASTGPHFPSPDGRTGGHGVPRDIVRHWGDLGNLQNRGGVAVYNKVNDILSLRSLLGRSVTVSERRDRGRFFQPSGGAGDLVALGVIGFANPASLTE